MNQQANTVCNLSQSFYCYIVTVHVLTQQYLSVVCLEGTCRIFHF